MNYFKKNSLLFVVFLTGACVLVIEIVATRILSPYYGNTIYTVSGVISTVLAALSMGYYFGGKLADKYPAEKVFYSIILISGLSVTLLNPLVSFLLPFLGHTFSIVSGPLVSAIALFFLPSLLLGAISPFAVKLQRQRFPEKGIGNITGEIFFCSTLGSIFGSLLAGFVLIPHFGIDRIVLSVAVILMMLGFFPLVKIGIFTKTVFKVIFPGITGILLIGVFFVPTNNNLVYSRDGMYEKITIYDGEYLGRPARFFRQDRSSAGAMFLDSNDPTDLAYEYTKYYSVYKVFRPDVKNALAIGGGAYSVPKALLAELPEATVDVSEIEPSLFDLAKKYFNLEDNPNLHNYIEDGRRFLYDSDKKYDLIFSDVYFSLFSIPTHFTTQEFFTIAKEKLTDGGVFIANVAGDLSGEQPSLVMSEIKTFRTVFSNSYFFSVDDGAQNIIFVGYNGDKKIDFNDPQIVGNENPVIKSLEEKLINLDEVEFSEYSVLTDNFAPVEYLTTGTLRHISGK